MCYHCKCYRVVVSCNNEINISEILLSGLVGAIISLIVTLCWAKIQESIRKENVKSLYARIAGNFNGPNHEQTKNLISSCVVTYIGEQKLNIVVTTYIDDQGNLLPKDQIQSWSGDITMVEPTIGSLIWEYIAPKHLLGRSGFKRIVVSKDFNSFKLIGDRSDGYGDEPFSRI